MLTNIMSALKRFFRKPRVAWTLLFSCLIIGVGAVGFQIRKHEHIDILAMIFGLAGILAAIFALLVTENTLDTMDHRLQVQTDALSDEIGNLQKAITNLEDATRKSLDSFAEIFAYALRLLNGAQEEVWYLNFLFRFGEPHKTNAEVVRQYEQLAKTLGVTPNYSDAVQE